MRSCANLIPNCGLAASLYWDHKRPPYAPSSLEAIWIITWGESPAEMPGGDFKQSGVGRDSLTTLKPAACIRSGYPVGLGRPPSVF